MISGFLNVSKPKGMTSFDVIRVLRKNLGIKKMGHLGTLDPIAEGVLIIAINEATKLIEFMMGFDKEYVAEMTLGAKTDTYDAEGEKTAINDRKPSEAEIKDALDSFKGEIEQTPPVYSALKVNGQPAYKRARQGEKVELKSRKITISDIKLESYSYPKAVFKVSCTSGTYIRSLINDIGEKLGVGAYMSELKRTKVGNFNIKNSHNLENINNKKLKEDFIDLSDVLPFMERIDLDEEELRKLNFGQTIQLKNIPKSNQTLFLGFFNGELKGVLENKGENLFKFRKQLHL
jgi:tRNA pseudouridine55 synthase